MPDDKTAVATADLTGNPPRPSVIHPLESTRNRSDTDRMCVTCGKLGGSCRWTDDAQACMRKQLEALRIALEVAEREAYRYASHYPQSSDGRNTFILLAERIAGLAEGKLV